MSKDVVKLMLRLPEELHVNLKQLSEDNNRSLNSYIVTALEDHITSFKSGSVISRLLPSGAPRATGRRVGKENANKPTDE